MCGIAWIVGNVRPGSIDRMAESLRHRGPDALSTHTLAGCAIGHARLSVIDLVAGDQPMHDSTGRFWIAFNGEIYNYKALRAELLREGVALRTSSDTEIVVEGWKRWGRGILDRVRGMFAFAIWNEAERTLFAARDLLGEKPLYYALTGDGSLVAASELKAILASGQITPRLSPSSLDAFLMLGYVPPDRTVYENVSVLPPGHCLEWRDGRVEVQRYWHPVFRTQPISLADAGRELLRLADQAVERQMVADVPIGAFLSGGVDSSTIVALMSRHTREPVKTFAVGFGRDINELPYARAVATQYATDHHEVDLGAPDVSGLLRRMVDVYDEPFADTSHIPTYQICGYARQHVKVALSGDGGDELFGGYWWYPPLAASETSRFGYAEWLVLRAADTLRGHRDRELHRRAVGAGFAARWPDTWSRGVAVHTVSSDRSRRRWWGGRTTPFAPDGLFRPPADVQGLNGAFHFDLTSYLPGDILVKVDRAAMAHGLETRAPFLDRDLVEFALSLPADLKVRGNETKVVMREAFQALWPHEIRTRGKQGFGAPLASWMHQPDVQEMVRSVSSPASPLQALLPGLRRQDLLRPTYASWVLFTLGLWLERHPEGI